MYLYLVRSSQPPHAHDVYLHALSRGGVQCYTGTYFSIIRRCRGAYRTCRCVFYQLKVEVVLLHYNIYTITPADKDEKTATAGREPGGNEWNINGCRVTFLVFVLSSYTVRRLYNETIRYTYMGALLLYHNPDAVYGP